MIYRISIWFLTASLYANAACVDRDMIYDKLKVSMGQILIIISFLIVPYLLHFTYFKKNSAKSQEYGFN
jgi:hypothetical protein